MNMIFILLASAVTAMKNLILTWAIAHVVDYTKGPIETTLKKGDGKEGKKSAMYDVVFDVVGGKASYENAKAVLRKGGRFITCVGPLEWIEDELLSTCGKVSWVGKCQLYSSNLNLLPGSHPIYSMVAPSELLGKETFHLAFENRVVPHRPFRLTILPHCEKLLS